MSKKKTTAILVGLAALAALFGFAGKAKADDEDDDLRPDDDEDDDENGRPDFRVTPATYDDPFIVVPAEPGDDPTKVVNRYLCPSRPDCRDGSLYQIVSGDNPTFVAKAVLANTIDPEHVSAMVAPYIAAMAVHSYNLALYSCIWNPTDPNAPASYGRKGTSGKPPQPVTQRYTAKEYDANGVMRRWYIGDAFVSKKHEANLVRLRGGNEPLRTTDETGRVFEAGHHYGLIWLPRITGFRPPPNPSVGVEADLPPDLAALMPNIYGG